MGRVGEIWRRHFGVVVDYWLPECGQSDVGAIPPFEHRALEGWGTLTLVRELRWDP